MDRMGMGNLAQVSKKSRANPKKEFSRANHSVGERAQSVLAYTGLAPVRVVYFRSAQVWSIQNEYESLPPQSLSLSPSGSAVHDTLWTMRQSRNLSSFRLIDTQLISLYHR